MERQLATIDTITEIRPIPGADFLVTAYVRGWPNVVQIGRHREGEKVAYFELDSMLPLADSRFEFLRPRGYVRVDGEAYHILRTAKIRGQISQGLIMPLKEFKDGFPEIKKYEPPIPPGTNIIGEFPREWAPKTDAERIQNLGDRLDEIRTKDWIGTEKIDGMSTTYINDDGVLRIASRNKELDATVESMQTRAAEKLQILENLPGGYALQGELFGPGIQGNPLRTSEVQFLAFDLYRKGESLPVPYTEWPEELVAIRVPEYSASLVTDSVESMVEQADNIKSLVSPNRRAEGIVWRTSDISGGRFDRPMFKVISNEYLARMGD